MTRINLKFLMEKKGVSVTEIASALKVSNYAIYRVLEGSSSSKRIESTLEAILDMPIPDIRTAWNNNSKPVITPEIKQAFEKFGVKAAV